MATQANSTLPPAAEARARLRRHVERHLSRLEVLIRVLDLEDGDADLEPTLGAPEYSGHAVGLRHPVELEVYRWAMGSADDREEDADMEPSLAAPETVSQRRWARGHDRDLEQEHDGREPSLGWTLAGELGGRRDLEEQCEDEGALERS